MILPENIQQTLKQYRMNRQSLQKKPIMNIAKLNNFMLSRMKNLIRSDQTGNDFILNRKFQSESIMKVSKRRQLYKSTLNQRRNNNIENNSLEISSFGFKTYTSLTIDPRQPIHSRKCTRTDQPSIQRKLKKDQITPNKPIQQLLSITHAIQVHIQNKNNVHREFLIRRHTTQRRARQLQLVKPYSKQNSSDKKIDQYRPWSRDKNNQQDVQPLSLIRFK